jgi:Holliday junction resolvasome RuvABC DNA-binding subunit
MFGKLLETPEVDRFADWIVAEVKKSLPSAPGAGAKNIEQRAERLNRQIDAQTKAFCQTTKLSIYKRARLAARVREGMTAHGYPDSFVKAFSYDLLQRIQAASKRPAKSTASKPSP